MATDNQRREVAAELRRQAAYCDGSLSEWWQRLQDTVTGEVDFADPKETFNAIADLIECRMCKDVGDGLTFRCSKCGCEFDMFDRDGEPTTWIGDVPRLPNYCPNCGAKCGAEMIDDD